MEPPADLDAPKQQYDDTPELARAHELPEVYNPQTAGHHHGTQQVNAVQQEWSPLQSHPSAPLPPTPRNQAPLPPPPVPIPTPTVYSKHDESIYGNNRQTMDSAAASTLHHYAAEPRESRPSYPASSRGDGGVFGRSSRLVLILSILCGILGMAVVGLAAGTGVVASKYSDTSLKLEHLSSSYSALQAGSMTATSSATSATATPTDYSEITNGCSDNSSKVTGTTYTSQTDELPTFTMFCNKDTKGDPITALFTSNFNLCMEACSSWNRYVREQDRGNDQKCRAVTFVPSWSNIATSLKNKLSGDCYLKRAPQSRANLPNQKETELHSAIIEDIDDDNDDKKTPTQTPKSSSSSPASKETGSPKLI